ncbi:MAG: pilus assembly protein TadG-related protein [Caulobacteraceae bacterium]|nr:pilus assembly protein TadG-related protein [Caulobacteraceae bacterium]
MSAKGIDKLLAGVRRWLESRDGSLTPIFALMAVPIVMATGATLDISRQASYRSDLQAAVDAAALGLAHLPSTTPQATLNSDALTWVNAELAGKGYGTIAVSVTSSAGKLTVNGSTTIPTTLTAMAGINSLPVNATATVAYGLSHVELALVLDNTGSMAQNNKLPTLVSSATSLVNTLSASAGSDPTALKISVVPFSMTVNVGSAYQTATWMSGVMPTAYGSDIFSTSNVNRFTLFQQMGVTWGGCVESRPAPYDVSDTGPSLSTPATLFVPYFAPDEPDNNTISSGGHSYYSFPNNYLSDGITSTSWTVRQGNAAKYTKAPATGTSSSTGYTLGPNAGCALTPLLRLTNNMTTVTSKLNSMVAVGDTNIPMGMMWGWHTLSPSAPFSDGVAYGTANTMKIVVMLTDGLNQNTPNSNPNTSYYSGDGYVWQNRVSGLNTTSQTARQTALDTRLSTLCSNMKAQGIIIYTVRIDVATTNSPAVLQSCATSTDKFFDVPNVPDLPTVFANIAGSIGHLRIAH